MSLYSVALRFLYIGTLIRMPALGCHCVQSELHEHMICGSCSGSGLHNAKPDTPLWVNRHKSPQTMFQNTVESSSQKSGFILYYIFLINTFTSVFSVPQA